MPRHLNFIHFDNNTTFHNQYSSGDVSPSAVLPPPPLSPYVFAIDSALTQTRDDDTPADIPQPTPAPPKKCKAKRTKDIDKQQPSIQHVFAQVYAVPEPPSSVTKSKAKKKETAAVGSMKICFDSTYDNFVENLAKMAKAPVERIRYDAVTWKFSKVKGTTTMPLANEDGFLACLSQVQAQQPSRATTAQVITVFVPEPKVQENACVSGTNAGQVTPTAKRALDVCDVEDMDETPTLKEGKNLDAELDSICHQLEVKYPMYTCSAHPNVRCVVQVDTGRHFDVNRSRLLSWALLVRQHPANYNIESIPADTALFKPHHAIKSAAHGPPATPVPAPPPSSDSHSSTSPPPSQSSLSSSRGLFSDIRSSSPFVLPPMTNEEFCNQYKLGDDILVMLNKLHFTVGCNLGLVTDKELLEAGFKRLSWACFKTAHRQWKEQYGDDD